jgi:signal transduction histidine kinase
LQQWKPGDDAVVYAEQVVLLYRPLALSVVATLVAGMLFAAAQAPVVDGARIMGWFAALCLVTGLRVLLGIAYQRASPPVSVARTWGGLFVFGAGLAGITWGVGGLLLFPADNVQHQIIVVLVLLGISAGGTTTLGVLPIAAVLFLVPTMLPVTYLFFNEDSAVSHIVGLMLLLSFGFFLSSTRNTHRQTRENIELRMAAQEREHSLARANAEIERASRAKSDFLANVSHEFRTPLNIVIGMQHELAETDLDARQRRSLDKARRAADALRGIVDTVLDFSRADRGLIELEMAPFSPHETCRDLVAGFAAQARAKGLVLEADLDAALPARLVGDAGRLCQVLGILLDNAVKFTDSGWVRLRARLCAKEDGGASVRFSVEDSGPGIGPRQVEHAFQPFGQGDSSSTRQHGGIGMGLATAVRLVELLGGRLEVDSASGKGSRFRFDCAFGVADPLAPRETAAAAARARDTGLGPEWQRGAVDDPARRLELLRRIAHELDEFDVNAVASVGQLFEHWPAAREDAQAIALHDAVTAYDFERAGDLLRRIRADMEPLEAAEAARPSAQGEF